jgi:large subunit ribosomal protein L9
VLEHPIKTLGVSTVRVALHPEVSIPVAVNVARSPEEAERQARGERAAGPVEEEEEQVPTAEEIFEGDTQP